MTFIYTYDNEWIFVLLLPVSSVSTQKSESLRGPNIPSGENNWGLTFISGPYGHPNNHCYNRRLILFNHGDLLEGEIRLEMTGSSQRALFGQKISQKIKF